MTWGRRLLWLPLVLLAVVAVVVARQTGFITNLGVLGWALAIGLAAATVELLLALHAVRRGHQRPPG